MCIKIKKIGKQEVGIWWVQKRFPRYGVPIWSLWPNIRFLPSTVTEKNATKNFLDRRTEVKQYTPPSPSGSGGIIKCHLFRPKPQKLPVIWYRKPLEWQGQGSNSYIRTCLKPVETQKFHNCRPFKYDDTNKFET